MSDPKNSIPVRDEKPQEDNSDKAAQAMDKPADDPGAAGRVAAEEKHAEEPSGYRGENPSTAGPGNTAVKSETPDNAEGRLNPSAPGDTGTTVAHTAE